MNPSTAKNPAKSAGTAVFAAGIGIIDYLDINNLLSIILTGSDADLHL
jgi:hypothetical protein